MVSCYLINDKEPRNLTISFIDSTIAIFNYYPGKHLMSFKYEQIFIGGCHSDNSEKYCGSAFGKIILDTHQNTYLYINDAVYTIEFDDVITDYHTMLDEDGFTSGIACSDKYMYFLKQQEYIDIKLICKHLKINSTYKDIRKSLPVNHFIPMKGVTIVHSK